MQVAYLALDAAKPLIQILCHIVDLRHQILELVPLTEFDLEVQIPLTNLLHSPGFLVLSGILQGEQEHSIRGIYTKQGLKFIKSLKKDEWVALHFHKK